MSQSFTLEYWMDGDWYVGRLKGVPGVFSQGQSLAELEENVRDAYRMMVEEEGPPPSRDAHTKEIEVPV
jgi:predicted RNase H-like HicB family nuclease